ncbi:MAG: lysophospholipid acyltransferase family protein [Rhodobacterales bacterium]|nr:lysophospholipid acyltransferase family protein [Rhodobacterales bacterium]
MTKAWHSPDVPVHAPLGIGDWLRVALRGLPLSLLVFGGLALLLLIRLFERPICGLRRPVSPYITQIVCRGAFVILGIHWRMFGTPMTGAGAVVANHSSWIDIFALHAGKRIYFVSKDEVANWPGIGWLARATGTVFIRRDPKEAQAQLAIFRDRLAVGHRLLFFPEGTSTDGRRVLPFKTTLFAAFLDPALPRPLHLQPVSVIYTAPEGEDPRFYGWWGDMGFGPHLLTALAARRQGSVTVFYHQPMAVDDFPDRKGLARAAEHAVRAGLTAAGVTQA